MSVQPGAESPAPSQNPSVTGQPLPWWQPFRTVGPVTVTYVDLSPDPARESAAAGYLDGAERQRCSLFVYPAPRRQFILSRAALRVLLAAELGCSNDELTFETLPRGKPLAVVGGQPAPISFNLSHSGGHGLVAVAPSGRLGVDIEERTPHRRMDLLARAALGPEELAEFGTRHGNDRLELFFRLWTMKEALLKAHGEGLVLDPTAFEIPRSMREGCMHGTIELPQMAGVPWRVADLGNEHFAAAVAWGPNLDAGARRGST